MIGYLYWTDDHKSDHETAINSLTLCGCVVGQILLGILADLKGRNRLYGWELVILIVSSLGVATSSGGLIIDGEPSMRIAAWIMFMRFIAGIGIGADVRLRCFQQALPNCLVHLMPSSNTLWPVSQETMLVAPCSTPYQVSSVCLDFLTNNGLHTVPLNSRDYCGVSLDQS